MELQKSEQPVRTVEVRQAQNQLPSLSLNTRAEKESRTISQLFVGGTFHRTLIAETMHPVPVPREASLAQPDMDCRFLQSRWINADVNRSVKEYSVSENKSRIQWDDEWPILQLSFPGSMTGHPNSRANQNSGILKPCPPPSNVNSNTLPPIYRDQRIKEIFAKPFNPKFPIAIIDKLQSIRRQSHKKRCCENTSDNDHPAEKPK